MSAGEAGVPRKNELGNSAPAARGHAPVQLVRGSVRMGRQCPDSAQEAPGDREPTAADTGRYAGGQDPNRAAQERGRRWGVHRALSAGQSDTERDRRGSL
uniref:(northern house mosquito) hypothetical protein n=1 Tax=Culex pipiens TaxID=7175 RepID=A0A8D8FRF8_CULPI